MPDYLIDEKKNLVEHQESTGEEINMIKKSYEFTVSNEVANITGGWKNLLSDVQKPLISGILKINPVAGFNMNSYSPVGIAVNNEGIEDVLVISFEIDYIITTIHASMNFTSTGGTFMIYAFPDGIKDILDPVFSNFTGTITLYLES